MSDSSNDVEELKAQILTDARYALRQLREFKDVDRAADAVERILERVSRSDG